MMPSRFLRALVALLCLGSAAVGAQAQDWWGYGRAHGVVLGQDEEPVAGARVALTLEGAAGEGPEPTTTDAKGRWALLGLAPGRWRLTIEAEGYLSSEGWVMVQESGPGPNVKVELQPLSMETPRGWEGSPSTIRLWLEKGNALLSQGHYAEARAEYEKALRVLPRSQQPEVLRAVARTHFMEGDLEAAERTLKKALVVQPDDAEARQILVALLAELDREAEAREWIARLDREGAEAVAPDLAEEVAAEDARTAAPADDRPILTPEAHRPGRYRTAFSERSPLSGLDAQVERFGLSAEEVAALASTDRSYDLAHESFDVYVPEGYDPQTAYGLLVWVSPGPRGGFARPETAAVLDERRLIWVGADNSGNDRATWIRMGLALDAVHNIERLYNVDPRRVYVAGYSGGGRTSSHLAFFYPQVFSGGFFLFGCNFYEQVPVPDRPGTHWPPGMPRPSKPILRQIRADSRFVLLTGERDFNRPQTEAYYEAMQDEGFEHVTYLEIPGADHYTGLDDAWFRKGIDALDAPLAGSAPVGGAGGGLP